MKKSNGSQVEKFFTKNSLKIMFVFGLCMISFFIGGVFIPKNADVQRKSSQEESNQVQIVLPDTEKDTGKEESTSSGIDKGAWNLILVNKDNPLPEQYSFELARLMNGNAVDKRAYPELQQMMDDMRELGLDPLICSSYRSNEKQTSLYDNKIKKYMSEGYSSGSAELKAGKWIAFPGTSEHETGQAVDIVAVSNQLLDKTQEDTAVQKWLMCNSYKYGFVLRYPQDKSHITGIEYEPWHYRYVGKQAAKEITERGICLEEYLNEASD